MPLAECEYNAQIDREGERQSHELHCGVQSIDWPKNASQ